MSGKRGDRRRQARPRKRFGTPIRLAAVILLAMSIALSGGSAMALADTAAETGVSVVVVNGGALDVHWEQSNLVFTLDGDGRGPTAAESASASTTLLIAVRDTRADAARTGYDVTLSASTFGTDDNTAQIGADLLMVSAIAGLPSDERIPQIFGATLDTPVTILSVDCHQLPVDTVLTVTIRLSIPAGTLPGAYAGSFLLNVTPATSCGL